MPFYRKPLSLSGFLRKTRPRLRITRLKLHGVRGQRATPAFVAQQSAESVACRSAWQRSSVQGTDCERGNTRKCTLLVPIG
jgi:hypothetical protein